MGAKMGLSAALNIAQHRCEKSETVFHEGSEELRICDGPKTCSSVLGSRRGRMPSATSGYAKGKDE